MAQTICQKKQAKSAKDAGNQAEGHSSWFNWLEEQIKIYTPDLSN